MLQKNQTKDIYYALRIASAMCFIGHGAFGIITKEIWTHYFGVFGIGHDTAYALMPYVGVVDICMGDFSFIISNKNNIRMVGYLGIDDCIIAPIIRRTICRIY